jgi:cardiolipin synthase A/B
MREAQAERARLALHEPETTAALSLADQAFARASGAQLIQGNHVRLLRDAKENYPAWLAAIESADRYVYFESYIIRDDRSGRRFAEALGAKARTGVPVRVLYDWMGAVGKTPGRFWDSLRGAGVEVRCFNPLRLSNPLGWIRRDHRKGLIVDGDVGFITGLCVGDAWVGDPARGVEGWRDTGIELRGPAVAEVEQAFRRVWSLTGPPVPPEERRSSVEPRAGVMAVRIVASEPARGGLLRVDELVAAAVRKTLWLTDAYFAGIPSYVQALRAAALDGVDVRLLVPGGTDIPVLRPISQAGYRPLIEAGVRVFEWNGPMLHAKTAVADGSWARVGSTNLNLASWIGNYELDALVENAEFARVMEEQYTRDLTNATEVLLTSRRRVVHPSPPPRGGGSAGRAAAGALRLGNTVAAAVANRRVLPPTEAHTIALAALLLVLGAFVAFRWPHLVAWPAGVILAWFGAALAVHAYRLRAARRRSAAAPSMPEGP